MSAAKRNALALIVTLALASAAAATPARAQGDAPNPSGGNLHSAIRVTTGPGTDASSGLSASLPMGFGWHFRVITELLARRFAVGGQHVVIDGVRLAAIQRRAGVR